MRQLMAAMGNDIKPSGSKWTARCPVHGDKDFAMIVSQMDDSSVLAHCYACGANGLDLYKHLGLDLNELFGGREMDTSKPFLPSHLATELMVDKLCVDIHEADLEMGRSTTFADKRRYRLAKARIKGIQEKFYT